MSEATATVVRDRIIDKWPIGAPDSQVKLEKYLSECNYDIYIASGLMYCKSWKYSGGALVLEYAVVFTPDSWCVCSTVSIVNPPAGVVVLPRKAA